jgi:hypothetical protein
MSSSPTYTNFEVNTSDTGTGLPSWVVPLDNVLLFNDDFEVKNPDSSANILTKTDFS